MQRLDKPAVARQSALMREKELRLALVCYGGVSLAVYMHGVTKEIWHLAQASRDFRSGRPGNLVYQRILETCLAETGLRVRILPDIIAGASAGGINGVYLAQAIESGQSLDPLTELWLRCADVDILLDPDARPLSRFTKFWAAPLLWLLLRRRNDTVSRTVAPETRSEVRRKLSNFIRARWFAPPFGGKGFTELLLNAFDAMEKARETEPEKSGGSLLPRGHPLDLFVTATDFTGHEERLRLNSPPEISETEHRLTIGFHARGGQPRTLADPAELAFAARATASFPGAFPPFTAREMDKVLADRSRAWPGRDAFLRRVLPGHSATGDAEDAVLIDGSVLANAPFAQAIDALKNRPARRTVDRRFVFIEPTPSAPGFRLTSPSHHAQNGERPVPGFFRTIFGAVSDIPREQPIRDNLEAIGARSGRIHRMLEITERLRPDIERTVDQTVGLSLLLSRPSPRRLAHLRAKLQQKASRAADFAYPAYGYLKYAGIIDDLADLLSQLRDGPRTATRESLRERLRAQLHAAGVDQMDPGSGDGASAALILFYRNHDIAFRIRRLRFLARRLVQLREQAVEGESEEDEGKGAALSAMQDMLYEAIGLYAERQTPAWFGAGTREALRPHGDNLMASLAIIAEARGLRDLDQQIDARFAAACVALPAEDRRTLLKAYLGFPYYDIATFPLLQGEGLDEYDPIKVDRISPEDAVAIRKGGAPATLRGIEFNCFGAFFSRAYRENDYLWGRLHGADRLIDILLSTMPPEIAADDARKAAWKRAAFEAILDEEEPRLTLIPGQIEAIRAEIALIGA
ncbi:patatin-related protein [Sphingobium sp. B12D2B]|nr:patatin-related protein [Sphingobium sp. B12D2B]